jgi:hypothetical protein
MRGREQAARDALDERIKVAFAQYYVASRALAVNREVIAVTRGVRGAGAGYSDRRSQSRRGRCVRRSDDLGQLSILPQNVFSGHAIMVTQAFPLWGKRDLRREAAPG